MTQSLAIEFTTLNYGEILGGASLRPLIFHGTGASVAISPRRSSCSGRARPAIRDLQPDARPHGGEGL